MTSVFLNLGEGFKDEKLNKFREQLEKRMSVTSYDYAREKVNEINSNTTGVDIFYFETDICRKNKNYIKAFCNLISCITNAPGTVYLMPIAPKEIVMVIREQWPNCDIYQFEYDKMKPSVLISK